MRDAKFFEQVKDTLLFKTTKGEYLTLNEYMAKNEGKLGKKVIYTNDATRQAASIAMYDAESVDVIALDALIDLNFVSFMEYSAGVEDLHFARVDADSALFTKEQSEDEKKQSEEDEKKLAELFKTATGKEDLTVKVNNLKDEALSALLTQDEQGRRFGEMSKIYGQDFKMPESHTLVLNSQNEVVKSLLCAEDGEKRSLMAAQLYDLARMSTRPLEKDEVTTFLTRSNKLLQMLCK
ncbi:MAG: molecular chaperone HtpG, partial [Clostridia bacterium]